MSNFGALLDGLTTVRGMGRSIHKIYVPNFVTAFNVQSRFQDRVIKVTDAFQKMDHFYWYIQVPIVFRSSLTYENPYHGFYPYATSPANVLTGAYKRG